MEVYWIGISIKSIRTKQSLEQFASKYQGAKAVIVATGDYRFIYDILEKYREVKLAHPYKTRVIAEAMIKNDRLDAKCSLIF